MDLSWGGKITYIPPEEDNTYTSLLCLSGITILFLNGPHLGRKITDIPLAHPSNPCQQLAHIRLQFVIELEPLGCLGQEILVGVVAGHEGPNHVLPCPHNIVDLHPGVRILCVSFSHCPVNYWSILYRCEHKHSQGVKPYDVLLSGYVLLYEGNRLIMLLQLLLKYLLLVFITTPAEH